MYTVDWIGTVDMGVLKDGKQLFAPMALEEGQVFPPEFKPGDELEIEVRSAHPAMIAVGVNYGYYEVTHVPSGTALRIMHRACAT
jgi:hypothetical protein